MAEGDASSGFAAVVGWMAVWWLGGWVGGWVAGGVSDWVAGWLGDWWFGCECYLESKWKIAEGLFQPFSFSVFQPFSSGRNCG
jgi:hypothetical protein